MGLISSSRANNIINLQPPPYTHTHTHSTNLNALIFARRAVTAGRARLVRTLV